MEIVKFLQGIAKKNPEMRRFFAQKPQRKPTLARQRYQKEIVIRGLEEIAIPKVQSLPHDRVELADWGA